jgi:hypothetical protein
LDRGSARRKAATYTQGKKHRKNAYTDIHAFSGIRTHDPRFRAIEGSPCLRQRGHCDRQVYKHLRSVSYKVYLNQDLSTGHLSYEINQLSLKHFLNEEPLKVTNTEIILV